MFGDYVCRAGRLQAENVPRDIGPITRETCGTRSPCAHVARRVGISQARLAPHRPRQVEPAAHRPSAREDDRPAVAGVRDETPLIARRAREVHGGADRRILSGQDQADPPSASGRLGVDRREHRVRQLGRDDVRGERPAPSRLLGTVLVPGRRGAPGGGDRRGGGIAQVDDRGRRIVVEDRADGLAVGDGRPSRAARPTAWPPLARRPPSRSSSGCCSTPASARASSRTPEGGFGRGNAGRFPYGGPVSSRRITVFSRQTRWCLSPGGHS